MSKPVTSLYVERRQVHARVRDTSVLEQMVGDLPSDEAVQVLHRSGHQAPNHLIHHVSLVRETITEMSDGCIFMDGRPTLHYFKFKQ